MCAIFGFVARKSRPVSLSALKGIVEANVGRGPHAFGFAWVDSRGTLRMYKQQGRLSDHVGLLALLRDARMIAGHVRWATHGDPRDQINNHPHPCDGGWIVHNGVVGNYERLVRDRRLWPVSECDSESIALLAEAARGTRLARVATAVRKTEGRLAMLGVWRQSLVAVRRGNPLHAMAREEGLYFATLAASGTSAGAGWREVPDGRAAIYCPARRGIKPIALVLPTVPPPAGAASCEQMSLYRGG